MSDQATEQQERKWVWEGDLWAHEETKLTTQVCPRCNQSKYYDSKRLMCSDCEDREDDARERRGDAHREHVLSHQADPVETWPVGTVDHQGEWRKAWTQEFVAGKRLYEIWEHKEGTRVIAQRLYSEHADRILADHEIARIGTLALEAIASTKSEWPSTLARNALSRIAALKGQTNA
jgi:hypothetical protein